MKHVIRGTQRQSRASIDEARNSRHSEAITSQHQRSSLAIISGHQPTRAGRQPRGHHQRSSVVQSMVISLLGRVDSPERRLSGALALPMRVVFRITELEREVDGDGLILRQLVPLHALPSRCAIKISGHRRCNQASVRAQQCSIRAHQGYSASVHLHVLIEPRVPSREWPNGQSPIRERYHLTPLPG
jgi:hypothetical protein